MKSRYNAILVLGIDTKKRLFKSRVDKAVKLYKLGVASRIIFSGKYWGGLKKTPENTEARLMLEYAQSKGVSPHKVLIEEKSLNTIGNLYFTKKYICKPKKIHRILIVTGSGHIPKARYLARKIFGRKYKIDFAGDDSTDMPLHGHSTLRETKNYFRDIEEGDDVRVKTVLRNHPYYKSGGQI